MNRNLRTAALLVAAALLIPAIRASAQAPAAGQTAAQQPSGQVSGNAAAGKTLYFIHGCYGCHGYNGETGTRFVGNPTRNLASETNFMTFLRLRADKAPLLPATSMPNYPENSLSDQQAMDIYAYIRSFKSNTPDVKDIPTLNLILEAAKKPYRP